MKKSASVKTRFILPVILMTAVLCAVMVLRTAYLLFHTTGIFYWKVFYQRGLPLVIGGSALCLILCAVLLIRSGEYVRKTLREDRRKWLTTGILMLICLAAALMIWQTRLGLEKENAFWGKPTVPLLEWHILPAFAVCLLWFCLDKFTPQGISDRFKSWLPLMIWLCAVTVWTAIPNQNGFFSPAGRAPNFET